MSELKAGTRVVLTQPLKLRPSIKVGTRGTVKRTVGYWGLVELALDGEQQPCLVRADHVAPLDSPASDVPQQVGLFSQ